jgi:O-acetyl-ADP-ribose deacetylase
MKARISSSILELIDGDITTQDVDAIVNAANSGLRGGGGVDGAIHRAGGPEIMEECRKIGRCQTGSAVITTGGRLPSRYVIHAVGPIWHSGSQGEAELLARAYRSSLQIAQDYKLKSIAFPSLSTGAYGYPLGAAAEIALRVTTEHLKGQSSLDLIRFVLFGRNAYDVYAEVLQKLIDHDNAVQRA